MITTHIADAATRRFRRALIPVTAALALLAWAVPGGLAAGLADVAGSEIDAVGDVAQEPSGGLYGAPDIRSFTAAYLDNADDGQDDDTVQATAVLDAGPASGIDPRILTDRVVAWWIDSDGNSATGYQDGTFGRGADHHVVTFGTSGGTPTVAYVRRFQDGAFQRGGQRVINLVRVGDGYGWSQPASVFGAGRGRNLRIWVEAAKITFSNGNVLNADRSPDNLNPLTLPVPPPPPAVQTGSVAAVGPTSASVAGLVDPRGTATQWFVRYGVGDTEDDATPPQALSGAEATTVSTTITGLLPSTEYRYQVIARSVWGESVGEVRSFTTPSVTANGVPVTTGGARRVTPTSAELTGSVTGVGGAAWFEWGPSRRYGRRTARVEIAPTGRSMAFAVPVAGLTPGAVYHYRLVLEVAGVRYTGARATMRATPLGRIALAGRQATACRGGSCLVRRLTVAVRARDARGRVLRGTALRRGLVARVRCVRGCRLDARVRLTGRGAVLTADASGRLRRASFRPGSVLEVRVVRRGFLGTAYRVTTRRSGATGRICALTVSGAARC